MELTEENLEYITFVAMGYCHLPKFNDEYSKLYLESQNNQK